MNNLVSHLVSFQAVEFMRQGKSPSEAASLALGKIATYYPKFNGGLVVVNKDGEFGWLRFICCHVFISILGLFLVYLYFCSRGRCTWLDILQVLCL